jgi:hypothetical protein
MHANVSQLVNQGRFEEARLSVAQANANGDINDPVVLTVYKEIVDTIRYEKESVLIFERRRNVLLTSLCGQDIRH